MAFLSALMHPHTSRGTLSKSPVQESSRTLPGVAIVLSFSASTRGRALAADGSGRLEACRLDIATCETESGVRRTRKICDKNAAFQCFRL